MTQHREYDTWAVKQAREVREQLKEGIIVSPDTSKMYKLQIGNTTFFFHSKTKLDKFKAKYKSRLNKINKIEQSFFTTNG